MSRLRNILVFVGATLAASCPSWAQDTWTQVIPGVQHLHRVTSTPRLLNIHVLIVDVTNPRVRVGPIIKNEYPGPDGGERTSSMAQRHNALAAINGDYFSSGTTEDHIPQGISVHEGYLIPKSGHVPGRLSWVMKNDLSSVIDVFANGYPYTAPSWMIAAASGGPRLVRDGAISIENTSGLPSAYSLNPRTGMGVSQDGKRLILAVVDGRQTGFSLGMTGVELGQLLIEMGAWNAMNFDSGGSSTFYLDGAVRNRPSDGSERRVANAIAVWDTADQGDAPVVIIGDSFEMPMFRLGALSGQGGWSGGGQIQTGIGRTGDQALRMDETTAEKSFAPAGGDVQWIDFWARRSSTNGISTISFGKDATRTDGKPSNLFGQVRFNSNGTIGVLVGFKIGVGFWQTLVPYTANQWHRISIRVSYRSGIYKYNVYVDGEQQIIGVDYRDPGSASELGWLMVEDSGNGDLIVDDLYVGNTRFDFPRVEPDSLEVPVGASYKWWLQNSQQAFWQIVDERDELGSSVPAGSIASYGPLGTIAAESTGSFVLEGRDEDGRLDQTSRVQVLDPKLPGEAKLLDTGERAAVGPVKVSATFSDHFYAQQPDRSSGIRVNLAGGPLPGTNLIATGELGLFNSEYAIADARLWMLDDGEAPRPLVMSTSRAAGPVQFGQPLDPSGLLISTYGRITRIDNGRFYLNDGSVAGDGLPVMLGLSQDMLGRFALVTGALGVWNNEEAVRQLKPRATADLVLLD